MKPRATRLAGEAKYCERVPERGMLLLLAPLLLLVLLLLLLFSQSLREDTNLIILYSIWNSTFCALEKSTLL